MTDLAQGSSVSATPPARPPRFARVMRVARRRLRRKLGGTPVQHGVLLALFALGAGVLLSLAADLTAEAIAERRAEDLRASLANVVPAALYQNDLAGDVATVEDAQAGPITVHRARKDGAVVAAAYEMTGQGYGGDITVLIGVDRSGTLLGVRVLSHTETPGLGDWIEAARSDWILGFAGLSLGDPPVEQWAVKKDGGRFDQFSGATITPRAVVEAIREGLQAFERNRDAILDQLAAEAAQ